MAATIIVGTQWGDEGKGKVIDVLTESADFVVRAQGGANAGHTVVHGGEKYVLHLIPSGILHEGKVNVIASGVVLDAVGLVKEIEGLRGQGVNITPERLVISESAHLVLPYHRLMDEWMETQRGDLKLGTTGRGIGPAYADKAHRDGLRVMDLLDSQVFDEKLRRRLEVCRRILADPLFDRDERLDAEAIHRDYTAAAKILAPFVKPTVQLVNWALAEGKEILFEGAQGTLLDIDFGTYPYVTSSSTAAGGVCTGTGVAPTKIDRVVGASKAYTTRVGEGAFPTADDRLSDHLHGMNREFGATTGRARRCGWLDGCLLRLAVMVNGISELAVTNLDGLDQMETVRLCTGYRLDGDIVEMPPSDGRKLAQCEPVYEVMPGWLTDTSGSESFADLPKAARHYLERLGEVAGAPVTLVGVGPERRQTLRR